MFKWPGVQRLEDQIFNLAHEVEDLQRQLSQSKEYFDIERKVKDNDHQTRLESLEAKLKEEFKDSEASRIKTDQINSILKNWSRGTISRQEMLVEVKAISQDVWFALLNNQERKIIELNQKFNSNEISIVEYKDGLKECDMTKWLTLATPEERADYELEEAHRTGKINDNDYEKAKATRANEPFFAVVKFAIDKERPENPFYMEFDWNQEFVNDLKARNYRGADDEEIIDAWFSHICTIVAAESENVIVTNPEELRRVKRVSDKISEHY